MVWYGVRKMVWYGVDGVSMKDRTGRRLSTSRVSKAIAVKATTYETTNININKNILSIR
jgi:hypothetical protein